MFEWFSNVKYNYGITRDIIMERVEYDGLVGYTPNWLLYIIAVLLMMAVAYFVGSINFAVLLSKLKYKDDIRLHGSGNGGATNMLRTYGKGAAALTYLGDFLKAVVVTLLGIILGGETFGCIAGLFCMVGHAYPAYFNFKGGKGVACASGIILCLDPVVFLICLIIFVLMVAFTKYVSLGSVMGAGLFPIIYSSMYKALHFPNYEGELYPNPIILLTTLAMSVLIIYLHRHNLKRITNGTENKLSFKKKAPKDGEEE